MQNMLRQALVKIIDFNGAIIDGEPDALSGARLLSSNQYRAPECTLRM